MLKAFLGLSLGFNVILFLAASTLSKDVPNPGNVCIPLYDATGMECISGDCVNK
jgi:hypothetical protein